LQTLAADEEQERGVPDDPLLLCARRESGVAHSVEAGVVTP
jgi:hypothetical protein